MYHFIWGFWLIFLSLYQPLIPHRWICLFTHTHTFTPLFTPLAFGNLAIKELYSMAAKDCQSFRKVWLGMRPGISQHKWLWTGWLLHSPLAVVLLHCFSNGVESFILFYFLVFLLFPVELAQSSEGVLPPALEKYISKASPADILRSLKNSYCSLCRKKFQNRALYCFS